MEDMIYSKSERETRRRFMKKSMVGVSGIALSGLMIPGCSQNLPAGMRQIGRKEALEKKQRPMAKKDESILSFIPGKDTRDAAYNSLKPLENTVARDIQGKQVVIKPNLGVIGPEHHHEVTDVNQLRGILDFLKPMYNRQIIVAEGSASQSISMKLGFEEYGYTALEREYNVKLVDANDLPTTTKFILAGYLRPQPINIIDLYLDPDVYLISACHLKPSGGAIVTLSIKNIAMGAPKCHYKLNKFGLNEKPTPGLNEKSKMHGGIGSKQGRELSYNIFTVATMGAHADLAVLDGVMAAEGNGPWNADPIEHGVAVASNDCVAADRLGSELMGVDYDYLLYIQWCAQAGIGRDDLSDVTYIGPDYKPYIKKYRLNKSYERQIEWIHELRENLTS